jgi:hypothetical protein
MWQRLAASRQHRSSLFSAGEHSLDWSRPADLLGLSAVPLANKINPHPNSHDGHFRVTSAFTPQAEKRRCCLSFSIPSHVRRSHTLVGERPAAVIAKAWSRKVHRALGACAANRRSSINDENERKAHIGANLTTRFPGAVR